MFSHVPVLSLPLVNAISPSIVTEPRSVETSMAWMPLFLDGRNALTGRLPRRLCDLLVLWRELLFILI